MTSLFRRIGSSIMGSSKKEFRRKLEEELRSSKSQLFEFDIIKVATNNFINVIESGEYGSVYKGELADGRVIEVKRFEIGSKEIIPFDERLKILMVLVSRLEHKNIMKLIGYCVKDEEVLTVYDYLPYRTLHTYLFDPTERQQLNWETRYKIIKGIANGLLYLHDGLETQIIHRNIKPLSIFLDDKMTPKISHFPLALTLDADQDQGDCDVIVGTVGYIAPEHLEQGQYSTKLDIFSFGVTILEIITGQKCNDFLRNETGLNFINYVWKHWNEGSALQVIDSSFVDECPKEEVVRCIQIGLACVQFRPEERPNIASVILMLASDAIGIPDFRETSFYKSSSDPQNEEGR